MSSLQPKKSFCLLLVVIDHPRIVTEIKTQNTVVRIRMNTILCWNTMFTGTLKTLEDCEAKLFSACTVPDFPGNHNTGSLEACRDTAVQFRKDYEACSKILDNTTRCECILDNITPLNTSKCNITVINDVYTTIESKRSACIAG